MPSAFHPGSRVLCLALREGSVGHAVLDGFGVADGSFFTSRLDHLTPAMRYREIIRILSESCQRFHPTRIVFGLPGALQTKRLALAARLKRRLAKLRVAVSVKRLRDAAGLLVDHVRYTMPDEIVGRLAEHFVPELQPLVPRTRRRPSYFRAAWYALAIALATLVEHHPYEAAALAQPSAFELRPFRHALQSSLAAAPPFPV